ncbi:MAG: hypothetical protein ACREOU_11630 [Candidatus Eiseniibacteriota bacterium]
MRARPFLVTGLLFSAAGDFGGGLWALLDWRNAARFMAARVPDWDAQGRAAALGLADEALGQLWANLGTALMALGAVQAVAALWVARERPEGVTLARLVGWALIVAGGLMATAGGQISSLVTEATRGLVILALAVWTRNEGR